MNFFVACLLSFVSAWGLGCSEPVGKPLGVQTPDKEPALSPVLEPKESEKKESAKKRSPVEWLVVGGGALPELNQVSLEADVREMVEFLGGKGRVLFGGGPGSSSVQVLSSREDQDVLFLELGMFFAPRGGRDSTYRRVMDGVHGVADRDEVLRTLSELMRGPAEKPLTVISTHGDRGETPRENYVLLWGDTKLSAQELAEFFDREGKGKEPRVVVTGCYSGGFSEIIFRGGQGKNGPALEIRCGLFASTADRVSSGCDPNPIRRQHEGYIPHFVRALQGKDRNDQPLAEEAIDFDGDGRISLLDAHTRVRIASGSLDVPTTTSERWLRAVSKAVDTPGELGQDPHEEAVIRALTQVSLLPKDPIHVRDLAKSVREKIRLAETALAESDEAEAMAFRKAASDLLNRWPVLNDPWHPDFPALFASERNQIQSHLTLSPSYQAYLAVYALRDQRAMTLERFFLQSAKLFRLERAQENLMAMRRLEKLKPEERKIFEQLRACENSKP